VMAKAEQKARGTSCGKNVAAQIRRIYLEVASR
jgi:hypothetical protein